MKSPTHKRVGFFIFRRRRGPRSGSVELGIFPHGAMGQSPNRQKQRSKDEVRYQRVAVEHPGRRKSRQSCGERHPKPAQASRIRGISDPRGGIGHEVKEESAADQCGKKSWRGEGCFGQKAADSNDCQNAGPRNKLRRAECRVSEENGQSQVGNKEDADWNDPSQNARQEKPAAKSHSGHRREIWQLRKKSSPKHAESREEQYANSDQSNDTRLIAALAKCEKTFHVRRLYPCRISTASPLFRADLRLANSEHF